MNEYNHATKDYHYRYILTWVFIAVIVVLIKIL